MLDTPIHKVTGLLSALALILLLLTPTLVSAMPVQADSATGMMAHGHSSDHNNDSAHSCWQQCLSSCASHCTPVLSATVLNQVAQQTLGYSQPNLYRHLFPSGLHRPPKF